MPFPPNPSPPVPTPMQMQQMQQMRTQASIEHLRVLSILYYVMGGMTALFSLIPLIHVSMGIAILAGGFGPSSSSGGPPPSMLGWIFVAVGGTIIVVGETIAICSLLVGRYLSAKKAWTFCLVVSGINCLHMPLGTMLGVFTITVLLKPEVKALFQDNDLAVGMGGAVR